VAKTDKRAAVQPEAVEPPIEQSDIKEVPPEAAWYVIHSYSGYENKVKKNLEHRIESMDMQDKIFQVVVPTEEEIELKDGQRRVVERRVFPGYVLVQMIMDEQSWYVVRNTPNVTGFVGMGNKPTALPDEEVKRIMRQLESEEPKIKVDFKVGQKCALSRAPLLSSPGLCKSCTRTKAARG
jgi:transcriptional antiterminator NusG